MLHAQNQDRLYLIAQSEEQEALIGSLAFNVQDRHWLVYCALGGHQHADLPELDLLTGVSMLDFMSIRRHDQTPGAKTGLSDEPGFCVRLIAR